VKGEPVLTVITALVVATVALLAAFGLDFTQAQTAAIVGWVAAVYGAAVLIRSRVSPVRRPRVAKLESRKGSR
jgi:hypothetical protein